MIWKHLVRIALGMVFCVSAILKLISIEDFELYVFSLGLSGFDFSSILSRLLVGIELLVGVLFVTRIWFRAASWTYALMLGGFSAFLLWRIFIGDTESCHCLGELIDLDPKASLLKNAVSCIALAFVWKTPSRNLNVKTIWIFPAYIVILAVIFIILPPDAYLRIGRTPNDVVQERLDEVVEESGLDDGRKVVCFFSSKCEFCRNTMVKLTGIINRHGLSEEDIYFFFMKTTKEDTDIMPFFDEFADGKRFPYTVLHHKVFLPVTDGSMPVILAIEDGRLLKEYDYITLDESEISEFLNKNE
ncbi:MAG: hypothetical protein E7117_00310 [Bacteroidales bacterium]|nr:hypothetical protein [Bacteroidales bacterium]